MEKTLEPFHSDRLLKFSTVEAFKYGDGPKVWSYVVTKGEPLCV
jgi:hypothetical protein